jgi:hypothetical protein
MSVQLKAVFCAGPLNNPWIVGSVYVTVDNPAIPANVYGRGIRVKPALVAAKFAESGQQGLW